MTWQAFMSADYPGWTEDTNLLLVNERHDAALSAVMEGLCPACGSQLLRRGDGWLRCPDADDGRGNPIKFRVATQQIEYDYDVEACPPPPATPASDAGRLPS